MLYGKDQFFNYKLPCGSIVFLYDQQVNTGNKQVHFKNYTEFPAIIDRKEVFYSQISNCSKLEEI